jgi:glycosyltransferase involved in cell wall biosynthesis
MHLAIFVHGGCGGALTNVSVSLGSGLALAGHTVDLVTLFEGGDRIRDHYRHVGGIDQVGVFPLGVSRTLWSPRALHRYLRERKPDVLYSQLLLCNLVAVLARAFVRPRIRLILVEGTLISHVRTIDAKAHPILRQAARLGRVLYPFADGIIAKSPQVEADLRRELGRWAARIPIVQLPNPYVFARIRFYSRQEVSWPWPTSSSSPILLSVGRLAEQKAFDVLIRALARLRSVQSCRLVILGDGPQRASLLALARQLGVEDDVVLPGRVDNPWSYMRAADAFVLPSRWEGMSSALIEAAALGCPIVASQGALSGLTWLEDGKSALLVPTDDVTALHDALHRVLDSPALRERLGRAAREAAERYDYRAVAADYARFAMDG